MKKIFLLVLLLLLNFNVFSQDDNLQKKVKTESIQMTTVMRYHNIPGVVLAINRANLAFLLSGTVDKVFVKIGQKVEKEQVLMSLYNPNLDPAILANLANLDSINAQIEQSNRDLTNLGVLRKNNSASKTAYEHKETELKNFKAQRRAIEAQITLSKANQQESLLKAPMDGIIVEVNKQIGEFIAAGKAVVEINQEDKNEVEVNIPKELWKNISIGMKLSGYYLEKNIDFRITELAQSANFNSHLMKVILQLETKIDNIVGQEVVIEFPKSYKNVYRLPLETIIDDGVNQPYIFIENQGIANKMYIEPLFIENNEIIFTTKQQLVFPVVIKGQSQISQGSRLQKIQ